MVRSRYLAVLSLTAFVLAGTPVRAQSSSDPITAGQVPRSVAGAEAIDLWKGCAGSEAGQRIEACGRIIGQPREPRANVALALRNRAGAYRQKGEPALALADLDRALKLEPRNAVLLIERGGVHFERGDDELAQEDFDRALSVDGKSAAALIGRAAVADRDGRLRAAVTDLDRAIRLAPKLARAHANRAHILLRLREPGRALADATTAIELDDRDSWGFEVRGQIHQASGDPAKALADFDRAVELGSSVLRILLMRAAVHVEQRDIDRAIADYDRAIAVDPRAAVALAGRAWAWHLRGENGKAIADSTAALEIEPRLAAALDSRGHARLALQEAAAALTDFDAALSIDEAMASAYLGRARARLGAGDVADALADLEKAVALPASRVDEQQVQAEALRLLAERRDRLALGQMAPGSAALVEDVRPAGAMSSAVGGGEPPVWTVHTSPSECWLTAGFIDRALVIFARAGLTGSGKELRFALSAESNVWRDVKAGGVTRLGPLKLAGAGETAARAVAIELQGRASLRPSGSKGAAVDIGPLDFDELRQALSKAETIYLSAGGIDAAFPAGDLWAWLPPFEACARALPREVSTKQ